MTDVDGGVPEEVLDEEEEIIERDRASERSWYDYDDDDQLITGRGSDED